MKDYFIMVCANMRDNHDYAAATKELRDILIPQVQSILDRGRGKIIDDMDRRNVIHIQSGNRFMSWMLKKLNCKGLGDVVVLNKEQYQGSMEILKKAAADLDRRKAELDRRKFKP